MDRLLKVGIIGCGHWGSQHARVFHELPESHLAWVCDLSQARLDRVQGLCPDAQSTREAREVLHSDVDAVVIATPASTHYALAMEALRSGKHVLIEKPMTTSVPHAEEIVAESDRRWLIAMVGHIFLYSPAVEAVKAIIASGELGDIYYVDCTRASLGLLQPDISVVWDLAPHDVSILHFVLDTDPIRVRARGYAHVQRHERFFDVAYLSFIFRNGIDADLRLSWLYPCKVRQYTIVGSRKMLIYDDVGPEKILIYDSGVDVIPCPNGREESFDYRWGRAVVHPVAPEEPLQRECRHFLRCVREGTEPRSSAREGLKVIRALEAVQRSLLDGQDWEELLW